MKKIANQLLKGYVINLSLILLLAFLLFTSYNIYTYNEIDKTEIDIDGLIEAYQKDSTTDLNTFNIGDNDYLVITDSELNIITQKNVQSPENKTIIDLQVEATENGDTTYYVFSSDDGQLLFHIFVGYYTDNINVLYLLISFALILAVIFAIIHAKRTSKTIVVPIEKLVIGVNEIQNNNYEHQINYQTNTELDEIRDAIIQLRDTLKEETDHRQRLEAERNDLILSLSHDIKTPLSNIIGYAQALTLKSLDKETKKSIEVIYHYGLTAAHLADELFDFAKMDQAEDLITSKTDIVEATRIKLVEYIGVFDQKNVNYNIAFPDKQIYCEINLMNYLRVLDNLISNALKYNDTPIDLNFYIQEQDDSVSIIIADDGIGIPKEHHKTIFEPMTRVEDSRNRDLGGTGLGLSIAKKIMIRHQGDITLDPNHHKGCRFILTLPKS